MSLNEGDSTQNLLYRIEECHPDQHESNGNMNFEPSETTERQKDENAIEEQEHHLIEELIKMPDREELGDDSQLSKRKRSEIWQHFTESNSLSTKARAKCIHCEAALSYTGGSTGNLLRHLKKKHSSVQLENSTTIIETKPELDSEDSLHNDDELLKRKRSEIWQHFTESNSLSSKSTARAKCIHCDAALSYTGGSTGNLLRHLKKKHSSVQFENCSYNSTAIETKPELDSEDSLHNDDEFLTRLNRAKRKRSEIWHHYSDVEGTSNKDADLAQCMHCKGIISYKGGSIGNLMRHIKNKHRSVLSEKPDEEYIPISKNASLESENKPALDDEESVSNEEELLVRLKKGKRKRSEIWQHYSDVEDIANKAVDLAKCIHCNSTISYTGGSIGNLMRHIKTKHGSILCEKTDSLSTTTNANFESETKPVVFEDEELVFNRDEYSCDSSDDYCEYDEPKRSANFTYREKIYLIMVVKKFIDHVECKKLDGKSKRMKQHAWSRIETEFNNISRTNYRDKKVLRKKYENMRIRIREKYESIVQQGNFENPLDGLNDVERDVMAILQNSDQCNSNQKISKKSIFHVDSEVNFVIEELNTSSIADTSNVLSEPGESTNCTEIPEPLEQNQILQIEHVHSLASTELSKNFEQRSSFSMKLDANSNDPLQSNRKKNIRSAKRLKQPYPRVRTWLGPKAKYLQMQHQFLAVEHSQTMNFQAAEHAERMKMLKLQQLLIRKQIEVEEQKLKR